MALSPKDSAWDPAQMGEAQRQATWTGSATTSEAALSHGEPKSWTHSPHTVMALPELVVRQQCLWPGDPRRTPPSTLPPLPCSGTAKMLVALDMLCLLLVSTPTILCESGLMVPHIQGFFCDDTSISYPRVAHFTIEDSALITMGFLISIFTISLGEMLHVQSLQPNSWAFKNSTYVILVYKQLGTFVFGGMANCSLASITKMTVGNLRPHFLAVCQPDPTSFNCDSGFISNYTCTGDPADVLEARKSFSEHTAFGIYAMLYLMVYVQARYRGCKSKLLRPTAQLFFLTLALCASYIHTLDYWNHPHDVAIRFLQGALVAAWAPSLEALLFPSQRCRFLLGSLVTTHLVII
nr:phospholipid phosphatase 3-like isoform X1 [Dasypus novemcinctus]